MVRPRMRAEERFHVIAAKALATLHKAYPVEATLLGIHAQDDRLESYDRAARRELFGLIAGHLEDVIRNAAEGELSPPLRRDWRLLETMLRNQLIELAEIRMWEKNPAQVVTGAMTGVFVLCTREFAPVSERVASVVGRLGALPRALSEAAEALVAPVRYFADYALRAVHGSRSVLAGMVPDLAARCPDRELAGRALAAAQRAQAALADYADHVRRDVLPRSHTVIGVGQSAFEEKLHAEHMLGLDVAELRAIGVAELLSVKTKLAELCGRLYPGRTVRQALDELKQDALPEQGLLEVYRGEVRRARDFVSQHRLASLPPGETLEVIETPSFERATTPYAAYLPPAPFETDQKGLFYVTPTDGAATPEERADQLAGHHKAGVPVTVVHEAYPGHHLQLCASNRNLSVVRRQFMNSALCEGWAMYCEELMADLGYYPDERCRLAQLKDLAWRAVRVILDVDIHTRTIDFDAAVEMLVNDGYAEPANARAEVLRYCLTPTQPMSYLIGKRAILALKREVEAAQASRFSLGVFHDRLLACGTMPPALVREEVLAGPS